MRERRPALTQQPEPTFYEHGSEGNTNHGPQQDGTGRQGLYERTDQASAPDHAIHPPLRPDRGQQGHRTQGHGNPGKGHPQIVKVAAEER